MINTAYGIPDHPDIRRAEATGYVHGEPVEPICPVCGASCYMVYLTQNEIVGCDECTSTANAWGAEECFPRKE